MYKSAEDSEGGAVPVHSVSLKGCEVTPDVNISQNKFGIKLEVPSADGMTEMCIRCESVSVRVIIPLKEYYYHYYKIY